MPANMLDGSSVLTGRPVIIRTTLIPFIQRPWPVAVGRHSLLCAAVVLPSILAQAQSTSDDPTDAAGFTLDLPALNSGVVTTVCTGGVVTAGLTLAGSTQTPASIIPSPPCGVFTGTTRDVWVRIDMPPTDDLRYRITVSGAGSPALSNGAMAAYTAPSVSGPFSLLACATGGNPTGGQFANPSLEVTCVAPGSRIYLRIWDELTPASNAGFSVCVQRQNFTTTPLPTVRDTPCNALLLTGAAQNIHNTFACTESFPWHPSCAGYLGGDVWGRFTVPANGAVEIIADVGGITRMGMTLYTAPDCASLNEFNEVACVTTTTLPATTGVVRCLPPGSTVYVRAYATALAQDFPPRFGLFRLRANTPSGATPTSPNSRPCDALPLTVDADCPAYTSGTFGFNAGACNTVGVPAPGCGVFATNSPDVWYSFTAPPNGTVAIRVNGDNTSSPAFNPAAALYTSGNASCAGPMTFVACDDKHGPGQGAYFVKTNLIPGQTYYLRVWGEGPPASPNPAQTGIFYICITSPSPPPGHCFYVVRLSNSHTNGSQTMRVAVAGDTTDYVTSGDPSQIFLVPVPIGAQVTFLYYNTSVLGVSNYGVAQLGAPEFWTQDPGGIVIGPSPPPSSQYTITSACGTNIITPEDCLGGVTICTAGINTVSSTQATGYSVVDLSAVNRGCLSDETNGGRWLLFRPASSGEVTFHLEGTVSSLDDLDFAIWDAGPDDVVAENPPTSIDVYSGICPPQHPPIRCSSARVNGRTGLREDMYGRHTEGADGYSWVAPLDVVAGHVYIMYVASVFHSEPRGFQLTWTSLLDLAGLPAPDILDCTPLVLPVELLFLEAEAHAAWTEVRWATLSEWESGHFEIERSAPGGTPQWIGEVPAAGASMHRVDYTFADHDPIQGLSYYRLKQVDRDGTYKHSDMVPVYRTAIGLSRLFPNPAVDQVTIVLPASVQDEVHITVVDAMGRVALLWLVPAPEGNALATIPIGVLAAGSYIVRITSGNHIWSERLIKR